MIKKAVDLLLFGSFYIAICAVAFCIQTNLLMQVPLSHFSFYLFVFGATLAHYNLHYFVKSTGAADSDRFKWSQQNKQLHKILIITGAMCCIFSLYYFQFRHFIFLAVMGVIAFLYSYPALPFTKKKRLKDFGILKIIILALLWTLVTVWFPLDNVDNMNGPFILVFTRRFIFMLMLCLLFDIRDTEIDKQSGIRTLPVRLGEKGAYYLVNLLLLVFLVLSLYELIKNQDILIFNALFVSTIASFYVIRLSRKYPSDYIYLAGVDGMMLLQSALVIIAQYNSFTLLQIFNTLHG